MRLTPPPIKRLSPQEQAIVDFIKKEPGHIGPEIARQVGASIQGIHAILDRIEVKRPGVLVRTEEIRLVPVTVVTYSVAENVGDIVNGKLVG